jgi:hypothetical protein
VVLWFAGMALVLSWVVFRDAALDHRLVVLGALVPDLLDGLGGGGAGWAHSLAGSAAVLAAVMVATIGHRRARRTLLAVPIGMFFHLVLDGAWADTDVFWWPLGGWSFGDAPLPVEARSTAVNVVLELAGAAALVWAWRRFGLDDPGRRRRFLRTGRLDRSLTEGRPPAC